MSLTSSTAEQHVHVGTGVLTTVLAALKRWWLAYITWRIERAAIATLVSMSDRDLKDIGIGRSEIPGVVKDRAAARTVPEWQP